MAWLAVVGAFGALVVIEAGLWGAFAGACPEQVAAVLAAAGTPFLVIGAQEWRSREVCGELLR